MLYSGITVLDMVGPLQVLSSLQMFGSPHRTVVVSERIEPTETDTPLKLVADKTFDDVPRPTVVIVPGGGAPAIRALGNDTLLDYVRSAAATAHVVGSACTGSLILAAAGLLEGRNATTHWAYHRLLERRVLPESYSW